MGKRLKEESHMVADRMQGACTLSEVLVLLSTLNSEIHVLWELGHIPSPLWASGSLSIKLELFQLRVHIRKVKELTGSGFGEKVKKMSSRGKTLWPALWYELWER